MAVKKKAENLTIEEKLAQALVPESEQPYEVPKNWCWTTLDKVSNVVTGKTPSKNHQEFYGNEFPFFKPADLDAGRNVFVASEYLSEEGKNVSVIVPQNSTAVCCIGSIGKSGFLNRDGTTNQQINSAIPFINPLYLYYFIKTDFFVNQLWEKASATTIAIVNKSKMEQCHFALAPLSEQQRIVERIESLFAKLDEAKEKLQEVLDGFEIRKAAILHKAFSGELTAKWREEHGVSLDSWRYLAFKDIADIKSNLVEPSMYLELPHIAPDNIEKNTGKLLEYRTVLEDNLKSAKHHFFDGQILYSKIRPNLSKVVMVDFEGLCSADMYPIEAYEDSKYLWYYMLSNNFLVQACNAGSRSVLPKINQKELSRIKVVVPSILEQRCIVGILDEHMRKEDMLKIKTEEALEKLDGIKKAILARAFRGELGTNDENDEWAVELLKRVIIEQAPKKVRTNGSVNKKITVGKLTAMEKRIFDFIVVKNTKSANVGEIFKLSKDGFKILDALRSLVEKEFLHMVSEDEYVIKE